MGEAMTLIAFYFAVISLASSLFFNQVEAWHGPVRSFETSLKEQHSALSLTLTATSCMPTAFHYRCWDGPPKPSAG